MKNPLLSEFYTPPFSNVCPCHIVPGIESAIQYCCNTVEEVLNCNNVSITWNRICYPLANANDRLSKVWSLVEHLNAVNHTKELRQEYEKGLQLISNYTTWIGQHKGLYQIYRKLKNSDNYTKLDFSKKKAISNILQDFELSGINLSKEKRKKYRNITINLSKLSYAYSNNVLDSTMGWNKLIVNESDLNGLPKHSLNFAKDRAKSFQKNGWLLTLDTNFYISVLTYCNNDDIRKEMYYAYNTRASDQGVHAGKWDNGPIMYEILSLRHELAKLIGFKNYVEMSVAKKMARSYEEILEFLNNLIEKVHPYGKKELIQLKNFAKKHFNCIKLNPWDILYYSEKQKKYLFCIDDEQLRSYFPESNVLDGLFKITERIYGIKIKEEFNFDTWNSNVRFFKLFDQKGNLKGGFYTDLYCRKNKRSGAWMSICTETMYKPNNNLQKPLAYLVCNFDPPLLDKPVLLKHNDVITLFHEFGHVLHHTLTRIDTPGVSGINGIPWDAIEISSQFMENYCWNKESLYLISKNYETKEPISNKLLNNLIEIKKYQSGLFIMRQLELSLFDILIHYQYKPDKSFSILDTLNQVKKKVSVTPSISCGRFPNTFSHIFSGGYAAGYYSYLWSNVLSSDIWSSFENKGIFNKYIGMKFLDNIISKGGSEDPNVLFLKFKKRKPKIESMLQQYGLLRKNL